MFTYQKIPTVHHFVPLLEEDGTTRQAILDQNRVIFVSECREPADTCLIDYDTGYGLRTLHLAVPIKQYLSLLGNKID